MDSSRGDQVVGAFRSLFDGRAGEVGDWPGDLFSRVAATVPAYRKFLQEHGIDPAAVTSAADFRRLPFTTKDSYIRRYELRELCRDGRLEACDMIAVSSGSSGVPMIWPRNVTDELRVARQIERVLRAFGAEAKRTLAVVCFPMGTWVGGIYTMSCLRHLAAKGFPLTVVAPGNNKAEILRILPELAPHFEQVVLCGYPPFLKDVVDTGIAEGLDWPKWTIKMVFAGEVFSESWRDLVAQRAGVTDPVTGTASLYGTADAGVLGVETPLSVAIRRLLAADPPLAQRIFGDPRLPTLVQYDPASRFFEEHEGTLLFSGDSGVPLIRYHIADEGGLIPYQRMMEMCNGLPQLPAGPQLPFVFVFGRSLFTVSFFGANIYPENVTVALEREPISGWVTGKFVLQTPEDADGNRFLRVTVELAPGVAGEQSRAQAVAEAVRASLLRLNSEFTQYVPVEKQLPETILRPHGDPEFFPVGVKHRYTRS